MAWTERQHALLRAMGVRVFGAPAEALHRAVSAQEPDGTGPAPAAVPAAPRARRGHPEAVLRPLPLAGEGRGEGAPRPSTPPASPRPDDDRRAGAIAAATAGIDAGEAGVDLGAVAGLDWPALRDAVAACTRCGLAGCRTRTVFGVGHERAQWLIVGEAPGENEDREGEPFVGAAGQLLDRMLAALRLTRSAEGGDDPPPERRVFIANTLKCRPPGNRNPAPDELRACEPFLVRQIELLQPRLILALGAYAARALLRSELPVGKLRGRLHRYRGVPLVVSYHPAYLLRSPAEKARAWDDLCLAASVAEDTGR